MGRPDVGGRAEDLVRGPRVPARLRPADRGEARLKLLLDTHALVWYTLGSDQLGPNALERLEDSECIVSAVAVWEIAIKWAVGKMPIAPPGSVELVELGFVPLAVELEHAIEAGALPRHHADPFDRMLIAQARLEGLTLLSSDPAMQAYDVRVAPATV
ncbi:MAG: type II toxin-antitoxin system VapC family toxin [Solirubrobacterales bacterium]